MNKNFIGLFVLGACLLVVASCGGKKTNNGQDAQTEAAAVEAGSVSKNVLTAELKVEALQFLADLPASDIPYLLSTGEIEVGVGNTDYMLPADKAALLTDPSRKARAMGVCFVDYNILKLTGRSTEEVEAVLVKFAADLNIPFAFSILKKEAPTGGTSQEVQAFYRAQENELITAMGENDKIDVAIEFLGGNAAQYACLLANPSLVVKGDATQSGLSDNMLKRVGMLQEIVSDLASYYPELQQMGTILVPLTEKAATVQTARSNASDITAIRDALLK